MKETRFIAQNKEKWLESEKLLKDRTKDPEKLNTLFTQIVDDLSYSRTFYPNRSVRVYLNKISREYFSIIYNHKKEKRNRFSRFWLDEMPQVVIHCRKQILLSLIIFLVAACIGIFSAVKDPEFTATILGESYVTMTRENIEKGDPMAVYKQQHQVDMFLGITLNNLMVAFRTYVMGVFFSVGTIAILLYNGIMVGCFQFFFVERGLFAESALTIWLHGTLEISSIILAGGAGLTLGSGLLFPGTYSRLQAFQISAIRSLKLMLGITPIFVFAAVIESFLTRYTDVPDVIRLLLILLSAAYIVGYFGIYPWLKSKKGFDEPLKEVRLSPSDVEKPSFDRIKNNAELLKDAFLFYKKSFTSLLPWILVTSLVVTTGDFFLGDQRSSISLDEEWWRSVLRDLFFAVETPAPTYILLNAAGTAIVVFLTLKTFRKYFPEHTSPFNGPLLYIQILIILTIFFSLIYFLDTFGMIVAGALAIVFFQWTFILLRGRHLGPALSENWLMFTSRINQVAGLQMILLLLCFSFLLMLSAPLLYMYMEVLKWQLTQDEQWARTLMWFMEIGIKIFAFYLIIPLITAAAAFMYFSLKEISSASYLMTSIERIGAHLKGRRI